MNQTYAEYKEELKAKQASKSREQIMNDLRHRTEHQFDPATAEPQRHNWVDRGEVMSCEGGDHPPHRAFKRR